LNPATLKQMVERYGTVFLKPVDGCQGRGIAVVERIRHGEILLQTGKRRTVYNDIESCWRQIRRQTSGRYYMVQQGIDLARVSGRPFDLRVMIQKDGKGKLTYTGMLAKVAGEGYRVTNVLRSHGRVTTVERALNESLGMNTVQINKIKQAAADLSERVVRIWNKDPKRGEFGMDLGVDKQGRLWFFEANTIPALFLFKGLPDKTFYRRIISTKNAFKRYLNKKKRLPDKLDARTPGIYFFV
jgi:hypothetical protein